MKAIRIFISSPGDVIEERDRARSVVEELRRRYAGRIELQAVLWEELPLTADLSFQGGIDLLLSERGVDVAVFILWSRLGSPLGGQIRKDDGAEYRSGTEREWDLMWRARAKSGGKRPRIIVYRRDDEASFHERLRGLPIGEQDRLIQQKKLLEQFITEEFYDQDTNTNVRAVLPFDRPTTFAQRLRVHLQELLDPLAGGDLAKAVWDIAKQGPPFLGLDAFDFENAPVFFGREDEIVTVRQLLRDQARRGCAFVMITGASGSGKSSLALAGVAPAIVANEVDGEVSGWRRATLTPSEVNGDVMLALARALMSETALISLRGEADVVAQLASDLAENPDVICRRVLRPALESGSRRERLILFVDQLEELFTDSRITAESRAAFAEALEALARSGFAWVLVTVRSDFYAQSQSVPALSRMNAGGGIFHLDAPGADALGRLIVQPAALAGLRFEQRGETSLADVILRDATSHRELLPLLEYLLHQLCAERTAEGALTFASYERLGGVEGALAQRADAVIAQMQPREATLDALLAALITLSGDEQESFVRRRVPRTELERDEASRGLVARLISERLLTSGSTPGGEPTVTVAHEAIFRVWPVAVAWLNKNREFLRLRANVAQSFTRWREAKENDSLLLPAGLLLEEGQHLLLIEAGRLELTTRSYVETSIARRKEQQVSASRRQRFVVAMLSVLTVLAVLGAMLAFQSNQERSKELARANQQKARADEEANHANKEKERANVEKQRAEAAAADAQRHAAAAKEANMKNLETLHEASRADYAQAVESFKGLQWQTGIAYLGRALRWEPGNREVQKRLWQELTATDRAKNALPDIYIHFDAAVQAYSMSPDETRVAIVTANNQLGIVDLDSGKQAVSAAVEVLESRRTPVWSPNSEWVAVTNVGAEGKISLVDAKSGTISKQYTIGAGKERAIPWAFDPTGKFIAVTTERSLIWFDTSRGAEAWHSNPRGLDNISFGADIRYIAAENYDPDLGISLQDTRTGRAVADHLVKPSENDFNNVKFSEDGKLAMLRSFSGRWHAVDLASGGRIGSAYGPAVPWCDLHLRCAKSAEKKLSNAAILKLAPDVSFGGFEVDAYNELKEALRPMVDGEDPEICAIPDPGQTAFFSKSARLILAGTDLRPWRLHYLRIHTSRVLCDLPPALCINETRGASLFSKNEHWLAVSFPDRERKTGDFCAWDLRRMIASLPEDDPGDTDDNKTTDQPTPVLSEAGPWVADLVEAISGQLFTSDYVLETAPWPERFAARERLRKLRLDGDKKDVIDPEWSRLLQWWLKAPKERGEGL